MRPVIIIGAARSGTKLLRSILASAPEMGEILYDVNFVWTYGHYDLAHDELTPSDANGRVIRFIHRYFESCTPHGARGLVEKTVSNTLRVPFVRTVFPNAKLIHLVRDGRRVVPSAMQCWSGRSWDRRNQPLNIRLQKIRDLPLSCWPYIWQRVSRSALARIGGPRATWGPRFRGIDEMVATRSLADVCAAQWARCVSSSLSAFEPLTEGADYLTIRYEHLIESPETITRRACEFADLDPAGPIRYALAQVSGSRAPREYAPDLVPMSIDLPEASAVLRRLGYC